MLARVTAVRHPTLRNPEFPDGEKDPEIRGLTVPVEEAEYRDAPSSAIARNIRILERAFVAAKERWATTHAFLSYQKHPSGQD